MVFLLETTGLSFIEVDLGESYTVERERHPAERERSMVESERFYNLRPSDPL